MLRTINIMDRCSVVRLAGSALIAIGVAAGTIGCIAFAAEPVSDMRSVRLAYDDVAAPANENSNASTSTALSSSFTLPPVIDIDAAVASRLPLRLSRSADELPLGTCLQVLGLPAGASLLGGQANPGKGWIVPLWALEDLKIRLPPEAASGEADLIVALIDNHDEVIDVQTTRLRIKPLIQPAPASSDQDAAPSATAEPSVADQKKAAAEMPSSSATSTTTKTSTISSKQVPDRPFELTSSDFRAARHNSVSLVKQPGLRENHRHTTGIAVADRYSTDFVMVNDLTNGLAAYSVATNPDLQVYPTPGTGDLKAIRDVLTLPSTDFAIVSIPVMNKLRSSNLYGDIGERLAVIGPLLTEELHVLALAHIHDVKDLAGKTVSLGQKGSLAATLGHDILTALDVKATEVNLDFDAALDAMRAGKVSAILLISGKPVRHIAERTAATSGFHFLAVPYLPSFERDLVRTSLTHDDYPSLVAGADVPTIGVRSALWVYRWPEQSERHRLVELFLYRLTSHLSDLQSGAFHPKWKEVDLNNSVLGWSRFESPSSNAAKSGQPKL